jgi:serine/threonine-protein kinase
VQRLLDELFDSQADPEQVCADLPELLPLVRRQWRKIRRLGADLDALFPAGDEQQAAAAPALPQIPGYEIEGVLGRGGMGIVYRAHHLRLNRPVALKMILAGPFAAPAERERFVREAEAVAGLRHPNIVQVYDAGEFDGRPYFTMEMVDGGQLAQRIAGAPQPARDAAALVAAVAEAVHAAHRSGIVHRDLKPTNILLTRDGTPKVMDFGLARRFDDGDDGGDITQMTLTGAPLGTPCYMAPEQARGEKHIVGPPADVYALGAILYELLTGRPPFRAETASATLQQVVSDIAISPARLNPRVPRDLETICLKCLHKEPARRFDSAQALADDLHRFERGEPIKARPLRWPARTVRWARRRPTAAALSVTLPLAVLLALALAGRWWWDARQRAANALAVIDDLRETARLADLSSWDGARAVLNRVEGRLAQGSAPDLRRRADQVAAELELGIRLENIRMHGASLVPEHSGQAGADREYETAFHDAQLANGQADPDEVAARIRASGVRRSIVAALDDWAASAKTPARQAWCLEVARRADTDADTDADAWRDRVHDPKLWQDKAALAELAAAAPVKGQSRSLLVAMGRMLEHHGGDAAPLYQRVLAEHPDDFWAHLRLGNHLVRREPNEAIGHFRAALAVRPDALVAGNNLAIALRAAGRLDEAIAAYERTLRIHPRYAPTHNNLGLALRDKGRLDEAQASFERAIAINPRLVHAHLNLGNLLRRKGESAKAIECYREAARVSPEIGAPHYSIGLIMQDHGRIEDAIENYQKAVQIEPSLFQARCNLGRLLTDEGRLDEAIHHLEAAVTTAPGDSLSHKHLARALQLKGLSDKALQHLFQSHYLNKEYLGAAQLSADTFAADPRLADDLRAGHRYRAARAAALAGCGRGEDAAALAEPQRARWRQQAVEWLRLDLDQWTNRLKSTSAGDRLLIHQTLAAWRNDPDLAGLRDPGAVDDLPPAERDACRALWDELESQLGGGLTLE